MSTTVVRNADWVIAWTGQGHAYQQGADVVFTGASNGGRITFVGRG